MKVSISDVVVTTREVDIPEACPNCDADFVDASENNLTAYEWQDQARSGHLGGEDDDMDFIYDEYELPPGGEGFISYISYACATCGAVLAEGTFETKDSP